MKTNNLKFSATIVKNNGENLIIKIRLNDECKNGHQDFAITGDLYKGTGRGDRSFLAGGCIHDEIAKFAPQFKKFIPLHLCDFNGVPMHATANGFYHMREGFNDKSKDHKTQFCEYYRVTPAQYDELKKAKDQNYYGFLLVQLNILTQWKAEAQEAIQTLESLTGDTFENDSVKNQLGMTEAQIEKTRIKVEAGHYSEANVKEREAQKARDKKAKLLQDLKKDFENKNKKALQNYEIDKIAINLFLTRYNIIFYDHTNTVVVNWQKGTYDRIFTKDEFNKFVKKAKANKYLKDLIFELK